MAAGAFNVVSERELKRNITPVYENNIAVAIVMKDIDKIQPSFYKYKEEIDQFDASDPYNFRANSHFGVIVDESPDYIQDGRFAAIDIYALSTMALVGVKYNRTRIKEIEKNISDFGVSEMSGNSMRVTYSVEFKNKSTSPVVTVTAMNSEVNLYISDVNNEGFTIHSSGTESVTFSWIAMAKYTETENVSAAEMNAYGGDHDLVVPENTKEMMRNLKNGYELSSDSETESETKGSAIKRTAIQLKINTHEAVIVKTKNVEPKIKTENSKDK